MKKTILLFITNLLIFSPLHAEIITDGTLGAKLNLPGTDFQVDAKLGQQHGGNLFHSFQEFNLQSHESATFSGPDSVQNVISRVTGGNPSNIDGLIRSTIPNADVYFLNPYGIMFGPNAKLDVQGGFHASTADYLRLGDDGEFNARQPGDSFLTVAPIESFGFLTDTPATITTQDSILSVPPLKPLSLIGGHLEFQGTLPVQFDELNIYATFATSLLKTTGGTLNLAAIGSSGEVLVDNNELTLNGLGGNITLNHTLIDTSSLGSGNLNIRGARLQMQESTLQTNTLGDFDGGIMDIQLTDSLYATSDPNRLGLQAFSSKALGSGRGGSITIQVPDLTLNRVGLLSNPMTEAKGGNINIEVARLSLLEGAGISNSTVGGESGTLTVEATESILVSGYTPGSGIRNGVPFVDWPSYIDASAFSAKPGGNINISTQKLDLEAGIITSATFSTGDSGHIKIQAKDISLTKGAMISTTSGDLGLAGNIQIEVTDTLLISGRRENFLFIPSSGQRIYHHPSSINSLSVYGSGGLLNLTAKTIHLTEEGTISASSLGLGEQIGTINLQAENLILTEGGQIDSSNGLYDVTTSEIFVGVGYGGDINIHAKQLTLGVQRTWVSQTGILSDSYSQAPGGNINIQTDFLDIEGDATISARAYGTGDAGQINLQTQHLHLTQRGSISTAATQSGGGNIELTSLSGLLYLDNSEITTSVATGVASGGNISIETPQFAVLNQGQIKAQADEGHGGNIGIKANQFIASPHSLVSASSRLGLDGNVNVEAPEDTVSDNLVNMTGDQLDASAMMKRPCSEEDFDETKRSHFYVNPINGVQPAPYDRQGSGVLPAPTHQQAKTAQRPATAKTVMASAMTECKKTVQSTQNEVPLF